MDTVNKAAWENALLGPSEEINFILFIIYELLQKDFEAAIFKCSTLLSPKAVHWVYSSRTYVAKKKVNTPAHYTCVLSHFSCVWLFSTLWIVALQALLSMGSSRQEYWSGLPCPPPENLSNPGIEPASLMSPALADEFFTTSTTWAAPESESEVVFGSFRPCGL